MLKIAGMAIQGHPVLGDLSLDFHIPGGSIADTVIIAGENGVGKSTVMDLLYGIVSTDAKGSIGVVGVELDYGEEQFRLNYELEQSKLSEMLYATDELSGEKFLAKSDAFKSAHPMSAIYSDVDINFHPAQVSSVTSMTLDSIAGSRKSSGDLPTKVNQLLIDVQALDDADVAYAARSNRELPLNSLPVEERMPRFTSAFELMFDDLQYDRIENRDGHKEIVFKKCGREVPIEALSSGEKQVIYRGCFLLKDSNATRGAIVFIDEPEISLHPDWQKKIMDYYKAIFTDASGKQTSQIFCVTHSPFIIHNDRRRNDKVIVLKRNTSGRIEVVDKPEYCKCDSVSVVEDAFSIRDFAKDVPTVYLEGRTDEKYFNRALEVFGFKTEARFKWVGHLDASGQERSTGASALSNAYEFLIGQNLPVKSVCLFDCDTNRKEAETGNVLSMCIPQYESAKGMRKGIENALALDGIDTQPFYITKEKDGDYGETKVIQEFKKMEFCEHVCSKSDEELKGIFANLKPVIDKTLSFLNAVK